MQPDLLGYGGNVGELGDAIWAWWVEDVVHADAWLRRRHGQPAPLYVWALRVGALLTANAAAAIDDAPERVVFWQPPAATYCSSSCGSRWPDNC